MRKISEEQIHAIEAHLAGILTPVALSTEAIQRLRERISVPYREEIVIRLKDWKRMFLVFGGVMSAMLVLITIARAFFHLVYRRQIG